MATRKRNVSFKDNKRDNELLKYVDEMSEIYGLSSYIKDLVEKDMKEREGYDTDSGSR